MFCGLKALAQENEMGAMLQILRKYVNWCFMPNQPVRLYRGDGKYYNILHCNNYENRTKVCPPWYTVRLVFAYESRHCPNS